MALRTVHEFEESGQVLVYDTDDVERLEFDTPRNVVPCQCGPECNHTHKLGPAHLNVHLHFKAGARGAFWKDI
jgi:hypothetical protein